MMEQADACKCHSDIIFIAGFNYVVIPDRAAGLGDIGYAALMSALHIVPEGEECVRTERNIGVLSQATLFALLW